MTYQDFKQLNDRIKKFVKKEYILRVINIDLKQELVELSNGMTIRIPVLINNIEQRKCCISNPSILSGWNFSKLHTDNIALLYGKYNVKGFLQYAKTTYGLQIDEPYEELDVSYFVTKDGKDLGALIYNTVERIAYDYFYELDFDDWNREEYENLVTRLETGQEKYMDNVPWSLEDYLDFKEFLTRKVIGCRLKGNRIMTMTLDITAKQVEKIINNR